MGWRYCRKCGAGCALRAPDIDFKVENSVAKRRTEGAFRTVVVDMDGRTCEYKDIAKDAAQAPEVLVFKPARIAPAVDFDSEEILSCAKKRRQVEFGGSKTVLAVADKFAVQPDIKGRFDSLKADDGFHLFPFGGNGEGAQIRADGVVFFGREWRDERLAFFPGIADVRILRVIPAFHLPMGWNAYIFPL